jgi:hypothetical protein
MIVTSGERNAQKSQDSGHQPGSGCMCGPTERLRKKQKCMFTFKDELV